MSRYYKGVAALSILVFLLIGSFIFLSPHGESIEHERDSGAAKMSPLPKALMPVVAESMGRDDAAYHINLSNDVGTAETPRHGLKTEFGKDGVAFNADGNSVELHLTSLGRGDQTAPVAEVSDVTAKDNRLEYKRGDVAEWYMNSPMGMEQGFTLKQRPEGGSDSVSVVLALNAGELKANNSENGKSIQFTDSSGQEVMSYGKLYVYDAEGKELESSMKVSEKAIVIAYNDTGAKYPVVVDPLMEVQRILASNGNDDDFFGWCSAVWNTYAVVGAPGKGRGFAYLFERNMAGVWTEIAIWRGENYGASSGADFGWSCDVAGTSDFGAGLTAFAVIGAPGDDLGTGSEHGSAFIFERDGAGSWSFIKEIRASSIQSGAEFGYDVAITQEGYILAGALDERWGSGILTCKNERGAAYFFERTGSWPTTQTQRVTASDADCYDHFGEAVGLDGIYAIIGAPGWDNSLSFDEGAAYAFERGASWSQNGGAINPSQVDAFDYFGASVDVYTGVVGTRAIVGAPYADYGGGIDFDRGEAYLLERTGGGSWTTNITRLRADNPQNFARFGFCVGIFGDYAIGGAPYEYIDFDGGGNDDVGAAYVYERAGLNNWPFEQKLTASDMDNPDRFAFSCDFDDLTTGMIYSPVAIVGAPYNNIGGEDDQGAAYLFEEEEQNGEITIVKQTIPDGFVGTFSFEGSDNLPLGNPCESFDLSDDDEQECGELPADTYEIVETVALDSDISISCDSGTWEVNPDGDGVIVDLSSGDDITCTFTNTLPLELGPIYPGIKNSINFMTANQATPGGKVAFVWGFQINPQVFAGPPCGGIVIDTNPFQVLGVVTADGTGSATLTFFVPALGNVVVVYTQAVDIPTCRVSDLITNILVNN